MLYCIARKTWIFHSFEKLSSATCLTCCLILTIPTIHSANTQKLHWVMVIKFIGIMSSENVSSILWDWNMKTENRRSAGFVGWLINIQSLRMIFEELVTSNHLSVFYALLIWKMENLHSGDLIKRKNRGGLITPHDSVVQDVKKAN